MTRMTEDFQKRQKPVAALIVALSTVAAGALVTLVKGLRNARRKSPAPVPSAPSTPPAPAE